MAEKILLAVPVTFPTIVDWRVVDLHLDWLNALITIQLQGTNGEIKAFSYDGPQAIAMMKALNTANLTVKSLHRRVMEQLIADGKLAGAISGAPDA